MRYELRTVRIWPFIRVSFFLYLVAGFLVGVAMSILGSLYSAIMEAIAFYQPAPGGLSAESIGYFLVVLPIGVACGLAIFGTVGGVIVISAYNLLARVVGGYEVELIDVSTAREPVAPVSEPVEPKRVKRAPPPPPPPPGSKSSGKVARMVEESLKAPAPRPQLTDVAAGDVMASAGQSQLPDKEGAAPAADRPMDKSQVRVRFAPSPTGYLHVGAARTAVFNFLFARHHGGKFLLRIEDTDVERSRADLLEPIFDALRWLGVTWDEEIVYQSQRLGLYGQYARQLLDGGHAYRCFLTNQELERERQAARDEKRKARFDHRELGISDEEIESRAAAGMGHTVRLRISSGTTSFVDMVSGEVSRDNEDIEDLVIARSDGTATYNLAVVVDDHDMAVSHVIRGNDHVSNTFKQIHIYRALGWDLPQFGHIPLILRPDKKKVSKRLGDKDVGEYRREGILPSAMFNYLCLLGWSPKTDREMYTVDELIGIFDERNFNASNAVFDEEKLLAFNKSYIAGMSNHDLAQLVAPLLVQADVSSKYWLETRWTYLCDVMGLLKERVRRLGDFVAMGRYFFESDYQYEEKGREKHFTAESAVLLRDLAERFDAIEPFAESSLEAALDAVADARGIKRAQLIHPTRLAVSGVTGGPGLFELLAVLGKPVVLDRLRKAIDYIESRADS